MNYQGIKEILKFELFYKLLIFCFVHPVLSSVMNLFIQLFIREDILFNAQIFLRFLTLPGILFLILYGCLYLFFVYYEYVVFLKMVALTKEEIRFDFKDVAYSALFELKPLKRWDSLLALPYFLILNPLWHLGYIATFMPFFEIPPFITGELLKMNFGSILLLAGYFFLFLIYGLLIYTPMYMVYQNNGFLESAKKSVKKMMKDKQTWFVLIGLFLFFYGLNLIIPIASNSLNVYDFNFYFFRYFYLSPFFRSSVYQFILLSVLWLIVQYFFSSFLTSKEFESCPQYSIFPKETVKEKVYRLKDKLATLRFKRTVIGLGCISILFFIIYYFNQFPLVHPPFSIGHRGHIEYPENTIEGILAADSFDTDYAEIDIQLTKDHELVLMHDTNLKQLTGKDININEVTLEELRTLNLAKGDKICQIPTLEEAIIAAKNAENQIGLLIEFKPLEGTEEETVDKTIELIEKYDFQDRAMFMSMNMNCVMRMHRLRPDWWTGYCAYGSIGKVRLKLNDEFYPDFLAIEETQINIQLLENARNNNLPIYVWTVDDPIKIENYLKMGVSGIIGDASDQVADSVKEYRENDHDDYLTTCLGLPKLTEDESSYLQCETE